MNYWAVPISAWVTAKHIRQGEASDEQRVLFMKTVNSLSAALLENALQEENDKHKQQVQR